MPVARVTLERTLVRGSQCPNNPSAQQYQQQTPPYVDLSQSNHRNERLKQKYDHNGQSMFTYGKTNSEDLSLIQRLNYSR